jgi:uncharacterized protein
MMVRMLALICLFGLTQPVFAACNGADLRSTLSDAERFQLETELAKTPYAAGNHWRATRGDKVIHLVGTMHLPDPRLNAPADRLRDLVQSADLLLLEMTDEDEAQLQDRISSDPGFLLMADATLPDLLTEEQWDQMSDALSARGLPPFMAARFQPWYVSMLLAVPPCASLTDLTEGGLDAQIESIAKSANVPRAALEDVETIFSAFADQPRETQVNMMLSALVEPQVSEDLFTTLLASYFDEAPAEGWLVSALLAERYSPIDPAIAADIFVILEKQLLVDRNRDWIPVILDAVSDNALVVAAFGAAHLPGQDGVLALLAAEGFTLDRLPF